MKPHKVDYDETLNDAGWAFIREMNKIEGLTGRQFNAIKSVLLVVIQKYVDDNKLSEPE